MLILSQHFSPADRVYQDAEGSLYHYPRVYFKRVQPYQQFVYYRPLGESTPRSDSKTYFGHGVIGIPYADPDRQDHRYVDVVKYEPFPRMVPLADHNGIYYETGTHRSPQGQSAIRVIDEIGYHRILAAAGVAWVGFSQMQTTEEVIASPFFGKPIEYPKDQLRIISDIPRGAGYVPHGDRVLDVYESASLHERARADHQHVLKLIASAAVRRGATCSMNNHLDLFVASPAERLLVEAKSLTDPRAAIDRMRYGIGQLIDYGQRYRVETAGALPVLAFGRAPDRDTSWIATVLESAGIGLLAASGDELKPLNDRARSIAILR